MDSARTLVYADDATSRLMELCFVASESAFDYFASTRSYLERHGKPVALYSDKASISRAAAPEAAKGHRPRRSRRALPAGPADLTRPCCGSTVGSCTWDRGAGHPGALIRGGNWNNGTNAGVFAVNANNNPLNSNNNIGFRCAR